jgi:hypothetical protein
LSGLNNGESDEERVTAELFLREVQAAYAPEGANFRAEVAAWRTREPGSDRRAQLAARRDWESKDGMRRALALAGTANH